MRSQPNGMVKRVSGWLIFTLFAGYDKAESQWSAARRRPSIRIDAWGSKINDIICGSFNVAPCDRSRHCSSLSLQDWDSGTSTFLLYTRVSEDTSCWRESLKIGLQVRQSGLMLFTVRRVSQTVHAFCTSREVQHLRFLWFGLDLSPH